MMGSRARAFLVTNERAHHCRKHSFSRSHRPRLHCRIRCDVAATADRHIGKGGEGKMAEAKQSPVLARITIRGVDMATWRRFKAEAALQGRELGESLNEVLSDLCDYMDEERTKAAKK